MQLTEILIERGLITPAQLRSVAGFRNLQDGQLGACLLAERLITADALAQALGVLFGVPPALDSDFARADPSLRKRLGAHQAARFNAIPLYVAPNRRVAVAMVDPSHPEFIDEMGFILGAAIEPMVTSEPMFVRQMELLYGMAPRRTTATHSVAAESARPVAVPVQVQTPLPRRPSQAHVQAINDMPIFVPATPAPPPPWSVQVARSRTPTPPPVAPAGGDAAVDRILSAPDRQTIVDQLFVFMGSAFGAGAMFVVNGVFAEGRFGFCQGSRRPDAETLIFSLSLPSCFHLALRRAAIFHGPVPPEGEVIHKSLWNALACPPPSEVVVAPVIAADQVAILLYAQGQGGGPIEKLAVARLQQVSVALGSALVRLGN
jgi:hypothetical protein